jgi:hypothetical protein
LLEILARAIDPRNAGAWGTNEHHEHPVIATEVEAGEDHSKEGSAMKRYLVSASLALMFCASADAATEILSATFPVPNFSCDGQARTAPIGPAPSTLTVIGVEVVLGVDIHSATYPNYTYVKDPAGNTMLVGGQLELHPRAFFPAGTGYGMSTGESGQMVVSCLGGGQMGAAATMYYTVP